jgi:hypothetical protein
MAQFVEMDDRGVETWEDMYDGNEDGAHDLGHDIWHYAQIPAVTILEMRFKHGVDIFNKNHEKRMFQLLNTDYPHLKTTTKTHTIKH